MTSLLRGLLRGNQSKHKRADGRPTPWATNRSTGFHSWRLYLVMPELLEDWSSLGREAEAVEEAAAVATGSGSSELDVADSNEGDSFRVKYLGCSPMDSPSGEVPTAKAIKRVIKESKSNGKKLCRVTVSVSLKGIKVADTASNEILYDISIYRISYCSADATFNRVFAFVSTNKNETNECHAFLCRKKKMAQKATLAIARTFSSAFDLWKLSQEASSSDKAGKNDPDLSEKEHDLSKNAGEDIADCKVDMNGGVEEKKVILDNNSPLIDFNEEIKLPKKIDPWVSFEDDEGVLPKKNSLIPCPAENEIFFNWGNDTSDLLSVA